MTVAILIYTLPRLAIYGIDPYIGIVYIETEPKET